MDEKILKLSRIVGRKLILMMRLSVVFLLFFLLEVSANGFSQPYVSVNVRNASVEKILSIIERQSDLNFLYPSEHLRGLPRTDLAMNQVPVQEVLDEVLIPNGLTYVIEDNTIVIREQSPPEPVEEEQVVVPQGIVVTGNVTDENGDGLPGVSISVKGTTAGTITGADGSYSITVDPDATLVFSFVGYMALEVAVSNNTVINVSLVPDVRNLEEIVVIGYGTVAKSDLTGSVSSLKADDMNPGANASIDQMMLGRAAGVQITQSSGEPGGGLSIRIRGASSINASNEPLYVIDGFPIDNSSNLTSNGLEGTPGGSELGTNLSPRNPLNSLNPNDIESIEILKDASATAIYGSRGANGVILVTTKKGASQQMTVNYNAYYGTQSIANPMEVMSTSEYINFINDVSVDQGNSEVFSSADIAEIGAGTDWQAQVYQSAPIMDHNLSVSGGIGNSKVYASVDYYNQDGIIKNTGMEKYIGRLNFDTNVGKKFNIGFNINTSLIKDLNGLDGVNTNESAGPIYAALLYDPTEPIYQPDGSFTDSPNLTINNPVSLIEGVSSKSRTNRTFVNLYASYNIIEGLSAKLNFGSDMQNQHRDVYVSTVTRRGGPLGGWADVTALERSNYVAEYTMTYNREFNENNRLTILGGITYQKFFLNLFKGDISGFPTDELETNALQLGDTNVDNLYSNREENTLLSYLGRINYTLYNKLLLTGSIRADGSSRFGVNNKYGYFPSFAVGYKLSEEAFIPDLFNELKVRASWGQTGNQEIGNYASQLTFGNGQSVVFNETVEGSLMPLRIANPDLKWETTTQINVGLDARILNNRITATLDYFTKNTTDLLFNLPLPASSGYSSILMNVGEVKNYGFEAYLNTVNISSPDFTWNMTLNFSAVRNEVLDLGRVDQIVTGNIQAVGNTAIIKVGEPLAAYWGYEVDGIQQTGDVNPGYPNFVDQNGDGNITPDDATIIGDPFPDFTYGLNNEFKYKDLSLSFFIQGMQGGDLLNINVIESMYPSNFRRNRLAMMLDRWTPSNTDAEWPSATDPNSYPGGTNGKVNTMVLQDASYIRLKNVQINYDIPMEKVNFIRALRIYVSGQNLLTFTNYIGFDPEANSFGRSNVKVDYSTYPLARTFMVGLNASF